MKKLPARPLNEDLANALHKVIGSHLLRSGLGNIWNDERTWRGFADELVAALSGKVVLLDRTTAERIIADAKQMGVVRAFVESYESMRPADQRKDSSRRQNPYAKWAAENMTPKEEP